MKLNKRIKSSLIQTFLFNIVLFIIIVIFTLLVLWPSFQAIEQEKKILESNHAQLVSINKEGIDLNDFRTLSEKSSFTPYVKELIKNIGDEFYSKHFTSPWTENFQEFFAAKQQDVESQQKSSVIEERNKAVDLLLPVYVTDASKEWITDFEFINYIESLLYSFNLVSKDSIWIWELKKVEDSNQINKNSLDSNMFYIPLNLEVTGQKGDILDFVHYLENVWSIGLLNGSPQVYSDTEITRNITWDAFVEGYNIYKNQLSDIQSISMQKYIDGSSDPVKGTFTDFIKTTQKRQKFSIELDLRFYVQGLPDYKVESYIKTIISTHSSLLSESKKSLKLVLDSPSSDSTSNLRAKNAIKSLSNILVLMEDEMKKLRVSVSKKDQDLVKIYNQAQEYEQRLVKIETVLQESMIELNNKK